MQSTGARRPERVARRLVSVAAQAERCRRAVGGPLESGCAETCAPAPAPYSFFLNLKKKLCRAHGSVRARKRAHRVSVGLRCLRAFSLLCALHTSTRVQSALDAHTARVRHRTRVCRRTRVRPATLLVLSALACAMPRSCDWSRRFCARARPTARIARDARNARMRARRPHEMACIKHVAMC